ncbi:MAG: helix-turn-helix transcriptional regulator [Bacillaceae bacterium]|nr:helix-turn-helix transcriptional regulator [Bacillaceae bacterium]
MLRFKFNLTQPQVAEAIGINVRALSEFERDIRFPKKDQLEKLAEFYQVEVEDILVGDED